MKNVECPKCLGLGEIYDINLDTVIKCTLCKGKKYVSDKIADLYDPIADELSNLKIEEYDTD